MSKPKNYCNQSKTHLKDLMLNNLQHGFLKELSHKTVGLAAVIVNTATEWRKGSIAYI